MVLFQNTNWVLTFQKWRLTSDTRSFETKEILFHLALDLLLHVCKMHLLLVLVVFNLRGREPIQERQKLLFLVPGVFKSYPRNLRGREPFSRKGVHLSAANTKWRILTHSVSGVVCDLLRARVTAEKNSVVLKSASVRV